jgi:hypothetical protein
MIRPAALAAYTAGVQKARDGYVDQLEQADRPACHRCNRASLADNVGCTIHRVAKSKRRAPTSAGSGPLGERA